MSNQPNPAQVPDQRLQQISDQLRQIAQENAQLRAHIDAQTQAIRQPIAPKPALFDERTQQALDQYVNEKMKPIVTDYQNRLGFMADQTDALKFQLEHGVDTYKKNAEKIEALRQEKQAQGQWIPRSDAYKFVHYEETSKKPAVIPEAPKGPMFDPYVQKWVTPDSALPPSQVDLAQQSQSQQVQQVQTPAPVQQSAPLPTLSAQAAPPVSAPAAATPIGAIDINTDPKILEAWAQRYGSQTI